ncbi:hypothetical protein [Amycolatopsis sp. NPDC057786]|uniref:hypothetical protein n=1 Tax=Amycolatopsis sp. NPDC057786 TaxID=3346250 RepID=UPI00366ECAEF
MKKTRGAKTGRHQRITLSAQRRPLDDRLDMLWHRRLTMDLRHPLGDNTLIGLAG